MRKVKDGKIILGSLVVLIAILIFVGVIVHATLYSPEEEAPPPPGYTNNAVAQVENSDTENAPKVKVVKAAKPLPPPNPKTPTRIKIPSLSINAKVQSVGITKKGNMSAPSNFTDVGWYKYGTFPGDLGSAVIDGHVDNGLAFPGVFKNLNNIQKGDDVYIETAKKETVHFVVTDISVYDYNAKASNIFNQKDDHMLRLITCTGVWVPAFGTHDKRLVVTAVREA
jgi:sortase A